MDIIAKIHNADQYSDQKKYYEAQQLYIEAFNELVQGLSTASNLQKVAKVGGWAAAFLTGGIGLEDLIVVPLVNKALLKLFGVDLNKSIELITHCLAGIIDSMPHIPKHKISNPDTIIYYYLVFYRLLLSEDNSQAVKDILNFINPFAEDKSKLIIPPDISKEEAENMLMGLMFQNFEYVDELNVQLMHTLYHLEQTHSVIFQTLSGRYPRHGYEAEHEAEGMTFSEAKKILGIPAKNSKISKSELINYRNKKIKEYHPDKYADLPPQFLEIAKEKTAEINEAYKFLSERIN